MIIVSYQGPYFTHIRAAKLAAHIAPSEYVAGLPEGSCGIRVEMVEDLNLTPWSVLSKIYAALADDPERKFTDVESLRVALFAALNHRAVLVDELPPASTRYKPDTGSMLDFAAQHNNGDVKPKKPRAPAIIDDYSACTTEQLVAAAVKRGYDEPPFANGGLRRMRLLNWLRRHP